MHTLILTLNIPNSSYRLSKLANICKGSTVLYMCVDSIMYLNAITDLIDILSVVV